jgi:hypothetical protein
VASQDNQDTLSVELAKLAEISRQKAIEQALNKLKSQQTPLRSESTARVVRSR